MPPFLRMYASLFLCNFIFLKPGLSKEMIFKASLEIFSKSLLNFVNFDNPSSAPARCKLEAIHIHVKGFVKG